MSAGELRERVGFYKKGTVSPDSPPAPDYGNTETEFGVEAEFIVSARIMPKLGGEDVVAARLTGQNLVNITIRYSAQAALVTVDWRAKDERTGILYNIRSIINPDEKKKYIEMLCEKGVAV